MTVKSVIEVSTGRETFVKSEALSCDLTTMFDFIALPKGHAGAEFAQTSAGEHVQVMPIWSTIDQKVRMAITGHRATKRVTVERIDKAIALLTAFRAEIADPDPE